MVFCKYYLLIGDSRIVSADKEESTLKMYTSPKKSVLFRLWSNNIILKSQAFF